MADEADGFFVLGNDGAIPLLQKGHTAAEDWLAFRRKRPLAFFEELKVLIPASTVLVGVGHETKVRNNESLIASTGFWARRHSDGVNRDKRWGFVTNPHWCIVVVILRRAFLAASKSNDQGEQNNISNHRDSPE